MRHQSNAQVTMTNSTSLVVHIITGRAALPDNCPTRWHPRLRYTLPTKYGVATTVGSGYTHVPEIRLGLTRLVYIIPRSELVLKGGIDIERG